VMAPTRANPVLELRRLGLTHKLQNGEECVLASDVSLVVKEGETVGLVGESGSGKTLTLKAAIGLLPPRIRVSSGSVLVDGTDYSAASEREWTRVRGSVLSMVFQDPMSSLNPLMSVGHQITEAFRVSGASNREANDLAVELLADVGIPQPRRRFRAMPHELSGGMRQRVVIAMALAGRPRLVLCDEPTTALDVTVQRQVITLLRGLTRDRGTALLYVSHDLAVVAQLCDIIAVMYAGEVVELGPTKHIINNPQHPYTAALVAAIPDVAVRQTHVRTIEGTVPSDVAHGTCCPFAARCPEAMPVCTRERPAFIAQRATPNHSVACFLRELDAPPARNEASVDG
jgi:oligopeptide/dipeptide ABC transporter ATP-binding protein